MSIPPYGAEVQHTNYWYSFLILPQVVAFTGVDASVPSESVKSTPRIWSPSKLLPRQADPNAVCALALSELEVAKLTTGDPVTEMPSVPILYLPGGNCVPEPLPTQTSPPPVHMVPSPQSTRPNVKPMLSVHVLN